MKIKMKFAPVINTGLGFSLREVVGELDPERGILWVEGGSHVGELAGRVEPGHHLGVYLPARVAFTCNGQKGETRQETRQDRRVQPVDRSW